MKGKQKKDYAEVWQSEKFRTLISRKKSGLFSR